MAAISALSCVEGKFTRGSSVVAAAPPEPARWCSTMPPMAFSVRTRKMTMTMLTVATRAAVRMGVLEGGFAAACARAAIRHGRECGIVA